MKASKTLATVAIMGALNACSAPSIAPAEINLPNNSPIKDKVLKNYRRLASNTPLSFVTTDETKAIRAVLKKMASIPRGQELIAAINDAPELFASEEDTTTKAFYGVSYGWRSVALNHIHTTPLTELTLSMMHEILHHLQDEQGRSATGNYFSPEQNILVSKLSEAETFSWDDVLSGMQKFFEEHKGVSYNNLTPFMQANLVAEAHREANRKGKSFNAESFKKTDALYLFQQALIQTGGDRAKAEKIAVGKRIALYMAPTAADTRISNWRNVYDVLSVEYTVGAASMNYLSSIGNPIALERIFSFYSKTYGVNKSQISNLHLRKQAEEYRAKVFPKIYAGKGLSYGDKKVMKLNGNQRPIKDNSFEK